MTLKARLHKLDSLYQAPAKVIEQASHDVEWALRWPSLDEPAEARFGRIVDAHGLDEPDMRRALVLALVRLGVPRDDAMVTASLGVLEVMKLAVDVRRSRDDVTDA